MKRPIFRVLNATKQILKKLKPKPKQSIKAHTIKKREPSSLIKQKLEQLKEGEIKSFVIGTQFTEFNQKATLITGKFIKAKSGIVILEVNGKKTLVPLRDIWQIK